MTKTEFLDRLRHSLHGLSDKDVLNSLDYYAEMIDDRMEADMSEEDAVAALGLPEEVAREIILNLPLPKIIKKKCTRKTAWRAWEIVLLVLASPIWLPLLLTAAALLFCVYAVLWVAVACLWIVDVSFGGAVVGSVIAGLANGLSGHGMLLLLYFGLSLVAAGVAVAGFPACLKVTVLFAKLSARFGRWVKSWFMRGGDAHVEG